MPRRKRIDDTKDEPDGKKAKSMLVIGSQNIRFEWENDGGKWTVYSDEFADSILTAYNAKKSEAVLTLPARVTLRILLEKSVQKNKVTGWERPVRLALQDLKDDEYYVWEWEDENGRWNPYGLHASVMLEESQGSGSVALETCGRSYTVDVDTMEQINDTTKVKRNVRREISGADVPADSTAVKGKSSAKAAASVEKPNKAAADSDSDSEVTKSKGKKGKAAQSGQSKATSGRKGKSGGATNIEKPVKQTVKTVLKKGAAPVDPDCPKVGTAHVFCEGKDIYDAMLNQTNLQNNNNKYYLMQLLEDDAKKSYSVWYRWGRVGKAGQNTLIPHGPDLDGAKRTFCAKFYDKSRNQWADRKKFVKVAGKYDLVELDYNVDDAEDEVDAAKPTTSAKTKKVPDSKLDQRLQDLINLICDVKAMEDAVVEMKYDAKKAPLGKLTGSQIKGGYAALKKIETCINKSDFGQTLIQACDEFYTRIPHDFGMARPAVIRTSKDVRLKMQLLETLADIEVAMKIIKRQTSHENPIDTHYSDLKCDLQAMDHTDPMFKLIDKYVQNTHASTHNQYKMEILDIFEVEKEQESEKFNDVGNRQLLWHGSRLTNWMGILSQGLRIAPPEAPVTGYMFGKGVYFADMSSKSANYCYATKSKNVGLVLLCEVALGKCNELLAADINAHKLPAGTHSVLGAGSMAPDAAQQHVMSNGTVIPLGKAKNTGVTNPGGYTLNYNEFIVYDLSQIKMKYLLKVKFNFKY